MFVVSGVNANRCVCVDCDTVCSTMMISDNEIGPEGAKALAPSLKQLNQLTTLELGGE